MPQRAPSRSSAVSAGWAGDRRGADGGLIPGVYGRGKISVATEIAYALEQRSQPYALLDVGLPELGGHRSQRPRRTGFGPMLLNLSDVAGNDRKARSDCSTFDPAGGAPGYRGHRRVGVAQRPGRPSGGIMAVGGKGQAVDNDPG